jgi:hypothetical protein
MERRDTRNLMKISHLENFVNGALYYAICFLPSEIAQPRSHVRRFVTSLFGADLSWSPWAPSMRDFACSCTFFYFLRPFTLMRRAHFGLHFGSVNLLAARCFLGINSARPRDSGNRDKRSQLHARSPNLNMHQLSLMVAVGCHWLAGSATEAGQLGFGHRPDHGRGGSIYTSQVARWSSAVHPH